VIGVAQGEPVIDLDEESHWWREKPISECDDCGGTEFEPVVDFDVVDFECVKCGSRWHVELGHVYRVGPAGGRRRTAQADAAT
jgi:hypothetical protein